MKDRAGSSAWGLCHNSIDPGGSCADLPQLRICPVEFNLARLWWCSDQRQPLQRPNSKGWRTETPCFWGTLCSSLGDGRPETPSSAYCTAMLLQITTICILGSLSPVACPPLRQSLSLGWPVSPGLGSTDKIKEVKEKIRHLSLKARLLKGHHAEQCWGSPLLPALPLGCCDHLNGYCRQNQAGCSSSWEHGCIHADVSSRVQQIWNSRSAGSGIKLVANEQLVAIFSKSRLFSGLVCVYPAELKSLSFSSEGTEGQ